MCVLLTATRFPRQSFFVHSGEDRNHNRRPKMGRFHDDTTNLKPPGRLGSSGRVKSHAHVRQHTPSAAFLSQWCSTVRPTAVVLCSGQYCVLPNVGGHRRACILWGLHSPGGGWVGGGAASRSLSIFLVVRIRSSAFTAPRQTPISFPALIV